MFKKLLLSVFVLFAVLSLNAQTNFQKGDMALNAGIGLGWGYSSGYAGITGLAPIPSFNASFEVGMFDIPDVGVISLGGFASFRRTWDNASYVTYNYDYTYTNTILAARGVFHFGFFDTGGFDLYAGIHSGVRISNYSYDIDYADNTYIQDYIETDSDVNLVHDVFVGARYMMSDKFGFFAEAGYGISYLKAGITLKF